MEGKKIKEKYNIDETHKEWEPVIDTWNSVELYRIVEGDMQSKEHPVVVAMKFLDDKELIKRITNEDMMKLGTLFLTAKRMIARHINTYSPQSDD